MAWLKFCSAIKIVRLCSLFSSLIFSIMRDTRMGARPTDGSSINRIDGIDIIARANEDRAAAAQEGGAD